MRRISLVVLVLAALLLVPSFTSPAAAQTGEQDVVASETLATIKGNVTDGDSPIAGATVVWWPRNDSTTRLRDRWQLHREPAARIYIGRKEGGLLPAVLESLRTSRRIIDLTLTGQPSTLTGTVYFNQLPLADVEVTVSSGNFSRPPVTTSSEGRYVISNIPAGNYTVTFSKSGYRTVETSIDMDGFKSLDMEMERAGLPISEGFLAGYDLAHSLMIVALGMAVIILVFALLIRYRVKKRPELLSKDESD